MNKITILLAVLLVGFSNLCTAENGQESKPIQIEDGIDVFSSFSASDKIETYGGGASCLYSLQEWDKLKLLLFIGGGITYDFKPDFDYLQYHYFYYAGLYGVGGNTTYRISRKVVYYNYLPLILRYYLNNNKKSSPYLGVGLALGKYEITYNTSFDYGVPWGDLRGDQIYKVINLGFKLFSLQNQPCMLDFKFYSGKTLDSPYGAPRERYNTNLYTLGITFPYPLAATANKQEIEDETANNTTIFFDNSKQYTLPGNMIGGQRIVYSNYDFSISFSAKGGSGSLAKVSGWETDIVPLHSLLGMSIGYLLEKHPDDYPIYYRSIPIIIKLYVNPEKSIWLGLGIDSAYELGISKYREWNYLTTESFKVFGTGINFYTLKNFMLSAELREKFSNDRTSNHYDYFLLGASYRFT